MRRASEVAHAVVVGILVVFVLGMLAMALAGALIA